MDFLDNAINKTKEVFDVACKKTSKIVTVEKQKIDVIALESKCDKDYCALGKIWFEQIKNSDNIPSEAKALVESIAEKKKKIDGLNTEILNSKSKRFCPVCGAAVEKSSAFCGRCGSNIGTEE